MNKFYKFLLTISSTLWFLAIWVVWYIFNLPKCESFKFEISIWLGCLITVVVPVFFSLVLKIFIRFLSKEDIKNVQSCNLADNEFLPVYLGYFFVALGIDNWKLLIVVYVLILIFTFVSNTQYFKGTQIILIIKGKIIRNKNEIKNMKFYRLNDTTYISRKVREDENE